LHDIEGELNFVQVFIRISLLNKIIIYED